MPYLHDPRRTVTVNLDPADYDDLAEDALNAGYASAGTYAKALVLHRGEAPPPVLDRRSRERCAGLEGKNEWLLLQYEALSAQLRAAGHAPQLARLPPGQTQAPRSRPAQDRAVAAAVAAARSRDAAAIAVLQAQCAALTARLAGAGNG